VIVHPPCDRRISRFLFDRGKLPTVSCMSSFAQKQACKGNETETSHQNGIENATLLQLLRAPRP